MKSVFLCFSVLCCGFLARAAVPDAYPHDSIRDFSAFTVKARVRIDPVKMPEKQSFQFLRQQVSKTGWALELKNFGIRGTMVQLCCNGAWFTAGWIRPETGAEHEIVLTARKGLLVIYRDGELLKRFIDLVTPNLEPIAVWKKGGVEVLSVEFSELPYFAKGEMDEPAEGFVGGVGWLVSCPPEKPGVRLPRILCFGDSVLSGYAAHLRRELAGKAYVYTWGWYVERPLGDRLPSEKFAAAARVKPFDFIVFNNGLHALHWTPEKVSDELLMSTQRAILKGFREGAPQARIFWMSTTPHTSRKPNAAGKIDSFGELNPMVERINRLTARVMAEENVPTIDAYGLMSRHLDLAAGDAYHWTAAGSTLLAQLMARDLLGNALAETSRWQAAIDAAAARGGGRVSVPAGVHPVGQLELKSNVELHLEKGAVLEGLAGMENYRTVTLPYSEGTWSAVVAGFGVTNVAITGAGEINGRGERFSMDFRQAPKGVCTEGLRPRGIVFADSAKIRLEGFTLRDAACWGIVFKCCDGVVARHVTVDSHAHDNNDGFDIEARNVLLEDCDVDGGDDGICIKSNNPGFSVENIIVRRCVSRSHCNALKLGTASHGTMRNVRFENCRTDFPRRFFVDRTPGRAGEFGYVRKGFESYPTGVGISAVCVECVDGGTVEDITYDGIDIKGYMVPIFVRGGSRTGRKCGIPPGRSRVLRNIVIRNVRGEALSSIPSSLSGVEGCRPDNVLLENVDLVCRGEGRQASAMPFAEPGPEFDGAYPEATMFKRLRLPAFGLYVDRADGVTLRNVRFSLREGEADDRQPVTFSGR